MCKNYDTQEAKNIKFFDMLCPCAGKPTKIQILGAGEKMAQQSRACAALGSSTSDGLQLLPGPQALADVMVSLAFLATRTLVHILTHRHT